MPKNTIAFLFLLSILATLLLGINIGKKLSPSIPSSNQPPQLSITQFPTFSITPTTYISQDISISPNISEYSTYTDKVCQYSFTYPSFFIRQAAENKKAIIFADPENLENSIAIVCSSSIPRPPVTEDKIEEIVIDDIPASLYHDQTKEGKPRDEVIVKHPTNNMEIIIAGYGTVFQNTLSSFRFTE